jgi:hypothetical protein
MSTWVAHLVFSAVTLLTALFSAALGGDARPAVTPGPG